VKQWCRTLVRQEFGDDLRNSACIRVGNNHEGLIPFTRSTSVPPIKSTASRKSCVVRMKSGIHRCVSPTERTGKLAKPPGDSPQLDCKNGNETNVICWLKV